MEKYHESVQGICLLNKLYLEPEIIKKIRYYCNFSVDITGYKNSDIVRYLTKDNKERYDLKNTKHRRELIRMLYEKKIHIPPNRENQNIRFADVIKILVSKIRIQEVRYGNGFHYGSKIIYTPKFLIYKDQPITIDRKKTIKYYNYEFDVIDIRNTHIGMEVTAYYETYHVSTYVKYDIDKFLFLSIHTLFPPCVFRCMKYKKMRDYMNFINKSNFSNEKYINEQFIYDCMNEVLEHIDYCLLKYGTIQHYSTSSLHEYYSNPSLNKYYHIRSRSERGCG